MALRPMTSASEVVEDYRHVGLTLRHHPLTFLRENLKRRRVVTCLEAMAARDGKWLTTAGLVLVRQKPGSAKGVLFIMIEDESGIGNLVIWTSLYKRQRRIILGASMMAVYSISSGPTPKGSITSRRRSRRRSTISRARTTAARARIATR